LAKDIDTVWDEYQTNPKYILKLANDVKESEINIEAIIRKETAKSPSIENDSLYRIKQDFVKYAIESQTIYARNRELTAISHALILEPNPITQDFLMELTGYGRSTISEALTQLAKLDTVEIIKKPKDRKKYYRLKYSLYDYMKIRSTASTKVIEKIVFTLKESFNKRILSLNINSKVKKKYSDFFLLNIKSYKIISEIIDKYFTVIYDKLSEYL
jgi:DNA-binding transcriptional regulator GbsR (MarR family)